MINKRGITLIALIITIIVMLILVGVTINFALNGGIIEKAKTATVQTEISMIQEQLMLKKAEIVADNMGRVPSGGYGLSSISDLNGLPEETIAKYNSKLVISADGILYYTENATGSDIVNFENAGITKFGGQQNDSEDTEDIDDEKVYNISFKDLSDLEWPYIEENSEITFQAAFYPKEVTIEEAIENHNYNLLSIERTGDGYVLGYVMADGTTYAFTESMNLWYKNPNDSENRTEEVPPAMQNVKIVDSSVLESFGANPLSYAKLNEILNITEVTN